MFVYEDAFEIQNRRVDQIVQLAAEGATDKEIAIKLGISPHTVATYWKRLRAEWNQSKRSAIILLHLRKAIERVNNELQEELNKRESIERELRSTTQQLQDHLARSREGWNSEFTSVQRKLIEANAKATLFDYHDRSICCAGAVAYEMKSIAPITYRFLRYDNREFEIDAEEILLNRKSFYDVIVEEDLNRLRELLKEQPVLPDRRVTSIFRIKRPEVRWLLDSNQPLVDSQGRIVGIAGICVDVNELVLAGHIKPAVVRIDQAVAIQPVYVPEGDQSMNSESVP